MALRLEIDPLERKTQSSSCNVLDTMKPRREMPITGNAVRRWAVISLDGRHTWLGRNSDPSQEEIASAEAALAAQGTPAWLAVVQGDYWSTDPLEIMAVRALAGAQESQWDQAQAAFLAVRQAKLASLE